jgi:beta-carotene 3-hydroxylase
MANIHAAILRAHGTHHSKRTKEDGESFGLLVVHPKFFRSRQRQEEDRLLKNNVE